MILIHSVLGSEVFYRAFWPLAFMISIAHESFIIARAPWTCTSIPTVLGGKIMGHSQIMTNLVTKEFSHCRVTLTIVIDTLIFIKGLITFHFSKNIFSFSKWVSEWAFVFKMWFFFEMCFHFQNVKGFVSCCYSFFRKTQL